MSEGWNRSNYANTKDTRQFLPEVGLLVSKHESPRTALFSPDMTDDCPIAKEERPETRITTKEETKEDIPGMKDHV